MSEEYAGQEETPMGEETLTEERAPAELVKTAILDAVLALKSNQENTQGEQNMENLSETAETEGEAMLERGEIANLHLDIEGSSRLGEAWKEAQTWAAPALEKAKQAFNWAKAPSTTYPEALAKAAVFSAGTTVFLAPVFLARNCLQVYKARLEEEEKVPSGGIAAA